jgi:hypothetical protein
VNDLPLTPPRRSAGTAPLRRPGSVRRTSSIEVSWPDGRDGEMRLDGRARDLVTPSSGGPGVVSAEDSFVARVRADRTITAIESDPPRPAMARLVGERGGGRLRGVLGQVMPEERDGATPLYLILDDISGASLVAGWAWSQWDPDWLARMRAAIDDPQIAKFMKDRTNVCIGHAPGSSAFDMEAPSRSVASAPAPDLRRADDPGGWHEFTAQESVGLRRARRIDVSLDEVIRIDSAFQDSGSTPQGGRTALHEYSLTATADPKTLKLLSIEATPRVLPFVECPSATLNLPRLLGTPLPELREKVLAELPGAAGCTHLNDALRALAEAPALLARLELAPA